MEVIYILYILIVEQQIIFYNFQDVCMEDLVIDFAEM